MKKVLLLLAAAAGTAAGVVLWKRRGSVSALSDAADTWPKSVASVADGTAYGVADTADEAASEEAATSPKKTAAKKAAAKAVKEEEPSG